MIIILCLDNNNGMMFNDLNNLGLIEPSVRHG